MELILEADEGNDTFDFKFDKLEEYRKVHPKNIKIISYEFNINGLEMLFHQDDRF
jgi:hypothetical protein